ncbi:bifunctional adenosylcobinamide kinase/adenosylcobinamide-phosphate guanylyltransferase [Actinokineospora auranticolor]|uniref:Adenosylcobinamide kinase n=1 Tax=Actinokineospora auranticolor TaxID=155976 RepID=A0A2S6GCZ2_9PSEU|nr:bifunctional adenosylcobinamide kinase/adenosylcobinamide-phosphate guanylyltransferase [Actinokineospora auranticolor]PPK63072.1 adenosylcobinamide kinase/adenosylcobinamide-phosphate guanylyltransferase [Actinokineospora auranticolor]
MTTPRTLVLGGARSGKSAHAEGLLTGDGPVDYLATARRDPADTEWSARIADHVARRPAHWRTVEVPARADLPARLRAARPDDPPLLVDDLATWLTGVLDDVGWTRGPEAAEARVDLAAAVAACPARLVLVSAEVGLGVIPSTRAGRIFRDELGALNAAVAAHCAEVLLLVAGIPLRLRG